MFYETNPDLSDFPLVHIKKVSEGKLAKVSFSYFYMDMDVSSSSVIGDFVEILYVKACVCVCVPTLKLLPFYYNLLHVQRFCVSPHLWPSLGIPQAWGLHLRRERDQREVVDKLQQRHWWRIQLDLGGHR